MELLKKKIRTDNDIKSKLDMYTSMVKKEVGDDYFKETSQKVNVNGDESFIHMLHITPNDEQHILMLAFLIENERYKQDKYSDFIQSIVIFFSERLLEKKNKNISDLQLKIEKLDIELNQNKIQKEQIEEIKDEYNNLESKYSTMTESYNRLLKSKNRLINQVETVSPFLSIFNEIEKKNDILIVTHNINPFLNTPFEKTIVSIEQFKEDQTNRNIERYIDKTVFITRVSFINTPNWMKNKRFLEKNSIYFYELSGYGIEEYLEQIIQYIYKSRGEISIEYINS